MTQKQAYMIIALCWIAFLVWLGFNNWQLAIWIMVFQILVTTGNTQGILKGRF